MVATVFRDTATACALGNNQYLVLSATWIEVDSDPFWSSNAGGSS